MRREDGGRCDDSDDSTELQYGFSTRSDDDDTYRTHIDDARRQRWMRRRAARICSATVQYRNQTYAISFDFNIDRTRDSESRRRVACDADANSSYFDLIPLLY